MRKYTDSEILAKFGKPGDAKNMTTITLPYPMRIAWDKKVSITKTQCHKMVKTPLENALREVLAHYGLPEIQRLGLDLFGGLYNFRKMRGGNSWSRHAWAMAFDIDPERNGLKTTWAKAQLSKPEYKPFMDIMAKHGFLNYGQLLNYDAMHFELGYKPNL